MNILKLKEINKLYFGYEEIARTCDINLSSARVTASRYVKNGFLIRLKRNLYMLKEKWDTTQKEDKFLLANLIQVPSYISLMTALDYYEITTQVQREFFESVALKRTKQVDVDNTVFKYTRIKKELYFGFIRQKGYFVAEPEKALLDAIYLKYVSNYNFDEDSIDYNKININKLKKLSKRFPVNIQKELEKNGYFNKA